MNHDLVTLDGDHDDHFQEVAGRVRADEKPTIGIFPGVFECERMVNGVEDVFVGDAVMRAES